MQELLLLERQQVLQELREQVLQVLQVLREQVLQVLREPVLLEQHQAVALHLSAHPPVPRAKQQQQRLPKGSGAAVRVQLAGSGCQGALRMTAQPQPYQAVQLQLCQGM